MTTEAREKELEDLLDFVQSPGWKRFCVYAQSQCGADAYRQRARRIMASVPADRAADVSHHLLQLEARVAEVESLMSWPADRIKMLSASRREVA